MARARVDAHQPVPLELLGRHHDDHLTDRSDNGCGDRVPIGLDEGFAGAGPLGVGWRSPVLALGCGVWGCWP
ncbi:MAG: hypothetical protein J2P15_15045, partial [Micromonosporaceae bacterium]|nr:hypothetical protein [Micromonosporaceae bacterium]